MLAVAVLVGLYSELFRLLPDVRQALISFHLSPKWRFINREGGVGVIHAKPTVRRNKSSSMYIHIYMHI